MSHDRQVVDDAPILEPIAAPEPSDAVERPAWKPVPCALRCQCCGGEYESPTRTRPACCREPHGMTTQTWLAQHCQGCGKCPRHCRCAREPLHVAAVPGWRQVGEW